MKKNTPFAHIILGIVFILFNIVAFVVPTDKTATFWITYAFSAVAFVIQPFVWKIAFGKGTELKIKFLGITLIHVGLVYIAIQLVAFVMFMAFPNIPSWIAVIVNALIVGVSLICLISIEVGTKEINKVEEKVKQKVFYIKELQVDVEMTAQRETDTETKKALEALAEKIRFSDPMSSEQLFDLENKIKEKVEGLKTSGDKISLSKDVELLLEERNRKCKLLK